MACARGNPDPGGAVSPSSLFSLSHPARAPCPASLIYSESSEEPSPRGRPHRGSGLPGRRCPLREPGGRGRTRPGAAGRPAAAAASRCLRGPACRDGHRWSGSGLRARGRCSHPWSLSCLVISSLSPCRPGPPPSPAALLLSPHGPLVPQPRPQDSRGSSRGSTPQVSLLWGRAEGRGPWGGWERLGWGASESINHAPLRSCLTHTSPSVCQ